MTTGQNLILDPETFLTDQWLMAPYHIRRGYVLLPLGSLGKTYREEWVGAC